MLIRGIEKIAKVLDVATVATVRRYASRKVDPLPLVLWRKHAQIDSDILERWQSRNAAGANRLAAPDLRAIEGIIPIAAAIGCTYSNVYKYAQDKFDPLPLNDAGARHPWVWRDALQDWVERQARPYKTRLTS